MTEIDYHAWTAVRSIGEAVTRIQKNDVEDIIDISVVQVLVWEPIRV